METTKLNLNKVKQFWHSVKKYGMPKDGGYKLGERFGFSVEQVDQIKQEAKDYRENQKKQFSASLNEITGSYIAHRETEKAIMLQAVYTTTSSSMGCKTFDVWMPKSQTQLIGTDSSGHKVYGVKGWLLQEKINEIPTSLGVYDFQFFDFIGEDLVIKAEV